MNKEKQTKRTIKTLKEQRDTLATQLGEMPNRITALEQQLRERDVAIVKLTEERDELRGNLGPDINDRFETTEDTDSFAALTRWVASERKRCEESAAIFDTGFRCVSEGGDVFTFCPEVIVDKLEDLDKKLEADNKLNDELHKRISELEEALRVALAEDKRTLEKRLAKKADELRLAKLENDELRRQLQHLQMLGRTVRKSQVEPTGEAGEP